ncbi:hypothetical protein JCM10213_006812 [Rhodosporidiobolus nylandii]
MPPRFLRVACAQLSPVFKDVDASIARADELIERLEPGRLDVLVLPEMALTGYCFESREDVAPFVERPMDGKTAEWARKTAQRLGCYVLIGAPTSSPSSSSSAAAEDPTPYYNSLLILSPSGTLQHIYHKHFLYSTDESWATPGPSFDVLDLPFPPSSPFHAGGTATFRLVPAICMDLNPHQFKAPFDAFELGTFAAKEKADIVFGSMAWLDSEPPLDDGAEEEGDGWESTRETMSYWALRVEPLLGTGAALVCANRTGREGDTVFTGSSCVMELSERPAVLAYAGKRREELVVARVSLPERGAQSSVLGSAVQFNVGMSG